MKRRKKKQITLGELIAAAYRTWGDSKAADMVKLAVKARLVVFREPVKYLVQQNRELYE